MYFKYVSFAIIIPSPLILPQLSSPQLPIAIDQPPLPNCVAYGKSHLCYKSLQNVLKNSGQKYTTNLRVAPVNNKDLTSLENNLQQMLSFISETCRMKGLPLYCQFLFPPCVENEPNQIFLTRSDCEALKRVYCHSEISLLKNFEGTELYNSYSYLNPNCNELPRASTPSLVSNLKVSVNIEKYNLGYYLTVIA